MGPQNSLKDGCLAESSNVAALVTSYCLVLYKTFNHNTVQQTMGHFLAANIRIPNANLTQKHPTDIPLKCTSTHYQMLIPFSLLSCLSLDLARTFPLPLRSNHPAPIFLAHALHGILPYPLRYTRNTKLCKRQTRCFRNVKKNGKQFLIVVHPASRAFLLLARFWRSRERLCMNRVRSLLNMRCMLPGYSLEPKPNMPDLDAILVFHGIAGSIITIRFVTKRTLAPEKPV